MNLVNKVTKSVKNLGLIPIATTENCPRAEDIAFKDNAINIYVALEHARVDYKNGDIRVTVIDTDNMRISSIDKFVDGQFVLYKELNCLYVERNKEDGKFTIKELNDFSVQDNATRKRKFLVELISTSCRHNNRCKDQEEFRCYVN